MRRLVPALLAAPLVIGPLDTRAADLTVWWDKGFTAQEAEGAAEVVEAFEQDSGSRVDLIFYEQLEFPRQALAALEANRPPDFAFAIDLAEFISGWAFEDRLVDLSDTIGPLSMEIRRRRFNGDPAIAGRRSTPRPLERLAGTVSSPAGQR
jgi:ABC-type glycerol-3-phosphate transport system substrate-binding protein